MNFLADFVRDVRYGFRGIRKTPVFTLFAVLSLGLGIGANTTVFTIINTVLLHPLPVDQPSRLVALFDSGAKGSKQQGAHLPLSYADFVDYAARQECFRGIAAFTPPFVVTLRDTAGPERMFGEFVTGGYFGTLGLRPALGRFFRPDEIRSAGSAPVAVLSHSAWKQRFAGNPAILGSTLSLNDTPFTVVGVAPPAFLGVSAVFGPDVWLPATMSEAAFPVEFRGVLSNRGKSLFHVVARLETGVAAPQAQANLDTLSAALQLEYPATRQDRRLIVRPVTDELFSNTGGQSGFLLGSAVLLAVVWLILGIACSNVANLLLSRTAARRGEVALRLAIGAGRGRLLRQHLTESVLLSVLGFSAGLAAGYAGCRFVWSFIPAEVVRNMIAPRLDAAVFLASLAVSLATSLVFGLFPAMRASRTDVAGALKESARSDNRARRTVRLADALLAGQVAFSLVCLVTAALFFRSVQHAYTIDPGFQTGRLALFLTNASNSGYGRTRIEEFYRLALERTGAVAGVSAAAWASGLPFWNGPTRSLSIEGAERRSTSSAIPTVAITADTDYFRTMGIPLLAGRAFDQSDREGTEAVAVINQTLAREHWPGGSAVGGRFRLTGDPTLRQVVGVVRNANYSTLGEAAQPCVYLPLRQNFAAGMTLYVRTEGEPASLLPRMQRELRSVDSNIRVDDVRTGRTLIQQVLWTPIVGQSLLGIFGALALVLASVGLYGVMAYSVVRRRKEIGVRMALGASRSTVLRLVLMDGMRLVGYGIAVGLCGMLLLGRVLTRMLFGISSADPVSLASASVLLFLVALLACYFPARSATRTEPMTALRDS